MGSWVVTILSCLVLLTVARPDNQEYEEYQYDEPFPESDHEASEEEIATNVNVKILTKPLSIEAVAGEKVELPCIVDKLPSKEHYLIHYLIQFCYKPPLCQQISALHTSTCQQYWYLLVQLLYNSSWKEEKEPTNFK